MGHLSNPALTGGKRALCARCLRPHNAQLSVQVSACICHWVTPVVADVDVLILQHPMETFNPKGTAQLLHLSLPGSQLLIGEVFAPAMLQAALHAPTAANAPVQPVLLYPGESGACTGPAELTGAAVRFRLVVIDGTWRKSRKMLHLNPQLQGLPRWTLASVPPSRYVIRKAHAPHQLSTLEASCAALAQLEEQPEKYTPLLAAMDRLVAQQLTFSRPA